MTDPDTNYASNSRISKLCFKGETLPGDNTMGTDELLEVKNMIDGIINKANDWKTNYTPETGDLFFSNTFIRLFKQYQRDEDPILTEKEENTLINDYGTPAICMQTTSDFKDVSGV